MGRRKNSYFGSIKELTDILNDFNNVFESVSIKPYENGFIMHINFTE